MVEIVQKGNSVLRKIAKEVKLSDIGTPHLTAIIKKMQTALSEQDDGVAIAAPQIGESLRLFVVSGKALIPGYPDIPDEKLADAKPDLICINPEIIKLSKKKESMAEGCLSVRWLYGNVMRSTKATIKAYDEHGMQFTRGASGLLAQIFQHECDHLNGLLFIDSATDIEDAPPEDEENHPVKEKAKNE